MDSRDYEDGKKHGRADAYTIAIGLLEETRNVEVLLAKLRELRDEAEAQVVEAARARKGV